MLCPCPEPDLHSAALLRRESWAESKPAEHGELTSTGSGRSLLSIGSSNSITGPLKRDKADKDKDRDDRDAGGGIAMTAKPHRSAQNLHDGSAHGALDGAAVTASAASAGAGSDLDGIGATAAEVTKSEGAGTALAGMDGAFAVCVQLC